MANVTHLSDSTFQSEVLEAEGLVLVDFGHHGVDLVKC